MYINEHSGRCKPTTVQSRIHEVVGLQSTKVDGNHLTPVIVNCAIVTTCHCLAI